MDARGIKTPWNGLFWWQKIRQRGGGTITNSESYKDLETIANQIQKQGGGTQRLHFLLSDTRYIPIQSQRVCNNVLGLYVENFGQAKKGNIPSETKKSMFSQEQYKFFLDADFEICNRCCNVMKKEPAHRYTKETGRYCMTGMMAEESRLRKQQWLNNGCNAFDLKIPISSPLAFWTEQDVLLYIYLKKLPIASIYGEVVIDYKAMGTIEGQTSLFPVDQWKVGRYEKERLLLRTTGVERSGCVTCGFGEVSEKESRWIKLKKTHPNIYNACFNGGRYKYTIFDSNGTEIKVKRVKHEMLEKWCEDNKNNPRFLIRKTWQPHKGFGYKHIIDWINEHGGLRKKIQY